jgi:hypothetical protein
MPWTAHSVADHEPVGERAVIVAAIGCHREHFLIAADQHNLLFSNMANKHATVR